MKREKVASKEMFLAAQMNKEELVKKVEELEHSRKVLEQSARRFADEVREGNKEIVRAANEAKEIIQGRTDEHKDNPHAFVEFFDKVQARFEDCFYRILIGDTDLSETGMDSCLKRMPERMFLNETEGLDEPLRTQVLDIIREFDEARATFVNGKELESLDERIKELQEQKKTLEREKAKVTEDWNTALADIEALNA